MREKGLLALVLSVLLVLVLSSFTSFALQVCSFDDAIMYCGQFNEDQESCTAPAGSNNFDCFWLSENNCISQGWTQTTESECACVQDDGSFFSVATGTDCSSASGTTTFCGNEILDDNEGCEASIKNDCQEDSQGNFCDLAGTGTNSDKCSCFEFCGDNIYQATNDNGIAEQCDGTDFPSSSACADYSTIYASGSLVCTSDCKISTAFCALVPINDTIVDDSGDADSDSSDDNATLTDTNQTDSGSSDDSSSDDSDSSSSVNESDSDEDIDDEGVCGNSIIDLSEDCESNFDCFTGAECIDCMCVILDTDSSSSTAPASTAPATCGNGFLDAGEVCDSHPDPGSYGWGCNAIEVCNKNCECVLAEDACGNKRLDGGEPCDGSATDGKICPKGTICSGMCACIPVKLAPGEFSNISIGTGDVSLTEEISPQQDDVSIDAERVASDSPDVIRSSTGGSGSLLFAGLGLAVVGFLALFLFWHHHNGIGTHPSEQQAAQQQSPQQSQSQNYQNQQNQNYDQGGYQ